jgi:hypothetical protein
MATNRIVGADFNSCANQTLARKTRPQRRNEFNSFFELAQTSSQIKYPFLINALDLPK